MRVLSLAVAAIMMVFAFVPSQAKASWKKGVFNTNTSESVTVAPRSAYRTRNTRRSRETRRARRSTSTRNRRASSRRSTRQSGRYARRGGSLRGLASYYWQPQRVASGGWFNPNALTAAHKSLPFGTRVRVTNMRNGRSVVVRINARGPYIRGRIIDLSRRAATIVGMRNAGVVPVRVDVL